MSTGHNKWGYTDLLAPHSAAKEVVIAPPPASDPLQDPDRLKAEIKQLETVIGPDLAQLFSGPQTSEIKIERARELVRLSQQPQISEQDLANASPEIRLAAQHLRERQGATAQQANIVVQPPLKSRSELEEEWRRNHPGFPVPGAPALPTPRFAGGVNVEAAPTQNLSLAEALDFIRDRGPDPTPAQGLPRERGNSRQT